MRINNAFVLAHHRVSEFAMEPHRIIPSLSPDADESEDADAVSDIFTRTQGQLRKIWRGLADSIVEAELAQLEQLVEKLSAEESDRIWDQLHDSVQLHDVLSVATNVARVDCTQAQSSRPQIYCGASVGSCPDPRQCARNLQAKELCAEQQVHAFPTIRIYRSHNAHSHEERADADALPT